MYMHIKVRQSGTITVALAKMLQFLYFLKYIPQSFSEYMTFYCVVIPFDESRLREDLREDRQNQTCRPRWRSRQRRQVISLRVTSSSPATSSAIFQNLTSDICDKVVSCLQKLRLSVLVQQGNRGLGKLTAVNMTQLSKSALNPKIPNTKIRPGAKFTKHLKLKFSLLIVHISSSQSPYLNENDCGGIYLFFSSAKLVVSFEISIYQKIQN